MKMDAINQIFVSSKKEITMVSYVQFIALEYVEITRFYVKDTKKLQVVQCPPSATQEEQKQKETMKEDSAPATALPTADMMKYYVKVKRIVMVA